MHPCHWLKTHKQCNKVDEYIDYLAASGREWPAAGAGPVAGASAGVASIGAPAPPPSLHAARQTPSLAPATALIIH